jgi:hypothetical protein
MTPDERYGSLPPIFDGQQLLDLERERERAFKAGYHCRWHREQGSYCFDPTMSPGDPEGAYAAWLRESENETQ